MTDPGQFVLSSDEARSLDAEYRGFPTFAKWADATVPADLWVGTQAMLAERRAAAAPTVFDDLVEQAMRAAALDTGAIEGLYEVDRGFTMSVASMASAWTAQIEQKKGPDVLALVMAQRRAYGLALDAATQSIPVSEAWIRRVHEEVCAAQRTYSVDTPLGPQQQELPKGAYKQNPNHVLQADGSTHAYAPVDTTPAEMYGYVQELRSPNFLAAHPVVQAAYAHYALTAIHPFSDGNGRVARVLASVYLLRAVSLPLVVYADQKGAYLDALIAADHGHPQAFVYFILSEAVDLQRDLAERLQTAGTASIDESLSRMRRALTAHGGLTHAEVDLVGQRLLQEVRSSLESTLDPIPLPAGIERQMLTASTSGAFVGSFRTLPDKPATGFVLQAAAPPGVRLEELLYVMIATEPGAASPFRVQRLSEPDALDVRLQELHPVVSEAFRLRLSIWVEGIVRHVLAKFATLAESAIAQE